MATIEQLEARITELEQRLPPAPSTQANPPVTIGELADVPAPGSPIASAWTQEVTRRITHRFATVAARDAAYPAAAAGAGAMCVTLDSGTVWTVVGTTWLPRSATGRMGGALAVTDQSLISAEATMVGYGVTFTAVAGRRYASYYTFGTSQVTAGGQQVFRLYDGATQIGILASRFSGIGAFEMVSGFWDIGTLSAGSHSLGLTAQVSAGTITIPNGSNVSGRHMVVDVGV